MSDHIRIGMIGTVGYDGHGIVTASIEHPMTVDSLPDVLRLAGHYSLARQAEEDGQE